MKKRGLKLLLLAIVMTFSFGLSAIVGASADGEKSFAMVGASVRTNESSGLRFEATVDKATYESVINDPNKTFGAFILPKDYLEAAEITAITNHKAQFKAKNLEYLNREDITGVQIDNEANADYSLKYSIVELHYYNYNRTFVGLFFIKTGDGDAATYEYATVNGANNERSIAYVSNAAIEHDESVDETAYKFALKAAYLGVNGYVDTKTEEEQNTAADTFFTENKETAADLYAKVKAVAAISAINAWDIEQKAAITAYNEAYGAADDVLKAWIAGISSYGACNTNATEFAAKSATAVADLKASINNLPAESEITVLSKAKVAELKNILEIAKDDLGSEYATLSAKLNAAENAINQNYKVLIDMSQDVYTGISDNLNDKDNTITLYTNYTHGHRVTLYPKQVDEKYGSYIGAKFKEDATEYMHLTFSYKVPEENIIYDNVYCYVYNGATGDKDVIHNFGGSGTKVSYNIVYKTGEWTLLSVPKADFISGAFFGILGAEDPGLEYKFSSIFTTDAAGLAKLTVYTSGIINAINNLPDAPETVGQETTIPAEVDAVITAYEAFGASERAIIDANPAAHAKLQAWLEVKRQVAVSYVIKAIDNMEEYGSSSVPVVYNSAKYSSVLAKYNELTDEQKAQVTNYAKLKAWTDAAAKVKSLYTSIDDFTSAVTVNAEGPGAMKGKDNDYGAVFQIRGQSKGNTYLTFHSYADLSGYDVVRFPIFMTGEANQYSLHKYSGDSGLVGYYTLLSPGWNIITVPVSFMMQGFVLGGSDLPGMTWLHYAVPYMEKLENGSKLSIGDLYASQFNNDAYAASVTFAKEQDPNEGRVLKVITAKNLNENYAFTIKNFKEYQKIVAESGATGVKFKIKNLEGSEWLYMPHAESGHDDDNCLKEIKMVKNEWVEVSLTAEEFARWKDGFFRRTWGAGAQFLMTDFTIVK